MSNLELLVKLHPYLSYIIFLVLIIAKDHNFSMILFPKGVTNITNCDKNVPEPYLTSHISCS